MEQENKKPNETIGFDGSENEGTQQLSELEKAQQRIDELEKQLKEAQDKAETSGKYHLQYYRTSEILKKGVAKLMESHNITRAEWLQALMEGSDYTDDVLLMILSK